MHCVLHCILCLCIACFVSASLRVFVLTFSAFLCISVELCHHALHCCIISHFVSLSKLCPSPALIDIGIFRCYQTSTAFPLCRCTHLGGFGVLVLWFGCSSSTLSLFSLTSPLRMVSDASTCIWRCNRGNWHSKAVFNRFSILVRVNLEFITDVWFGINREHSCCNLKMVDSMLLSHSAVLD